MIYGGSAAVHALLMAPSSGLAKPTIPGGNVTQWNGTEITVSALATDLDSHATLAIIVTGLSLVYPIAIILTQVRRSGAVPILSLWIFLMFVGAVACAAILVGANHRSAALPHLLPQARFCSEGYNDSLPFSGTPPTIINNSWNETVWSFFTNFTINTPSCIYPCGSATYFLRQPGDLHIVNNVDLAKLPHTLSRGLNIGIAGWSILALIAIILATRSEIMRQRGHHSWRSVVAYGFLHPIQLRFTTKSGINVVWTFTFWKEILLMLWLTMVLIFVEWMISHDLQSEEIQLMGQWAPLVGAGLVLIAAFVGKYWPKARGLWFKFQERRELAKRSGVKEGMLESLTHVWKEKEDRSAWSQVGIVFSQGDDFD